MNDIVMVPTKKSQVFDPIFQRLPYPLAAGLVRGIRSLITIVISALVLSVADGTLFKDISIISPDQKLLLTAVLSPVLMAIDKWLRERGLEDEIKDTEISVAQPGPSNTEPQGEPPLDIPNP